MKKTDLYNCISFKEFNCKFKVQIQSCWYVYSVISVIFLSPRSWAYPRLLARPSWESHSAGRFGNSRRLPQEKPWQWLIPWPTIPCGHNQTGPQHGWCLSRAPVCLSYQEPGHCGRLRLRALLWRRCAVVYFFGHWCIMQCWAAVQNICRSPHPAYFLCHCSPASRGLASSPCLELVFFSISFFLI